MSVIRTVAKCMINSATRGHPPGISLPYMNLRNALNQKLPPLQKYISPATKHNIWAPTSKPILNNILPTRIKPTPQIEPAYFHIEKLDPVPAIEIKDPRKVIEKLAVRMLVIMHKKMKTHKKKKHLRKNKHRIQQVRSMFIRRKEKMLQATLVAQLRQATRFSAQNYAEEMIANAKKKLTVIPLTPSQIARLKGIEHHKRCRKPITPELYPDPFAEDYFNQPYFKKK